MARPNIAKNVHVTENPVTENPVTDTFEHAPENPVAENPAPTLAAASGFMIEDNVTLPEQYSKRRGRAARFPVDDLGVGQGFFVAPGAKLADPVAALTTAAGAARARWATPTGTFRTITHRISKEPIQVERRTVTRDYKVVAMEREGVKGAFIKRIA